MSRPDGSEGAPDTDASSGPALNILPRPNADPDSVDAPTEADVPSALNNPAFAPSQAEQEQPSGKAPSTAAGREGVPPREIFAESGADLASCLATLDAVGTRYERLDPVEEEAQPGCGIVNPIRVTEIVPGVALEPPPVLRCATALAATHWVTDVVLPLGKKLTDRGALVTIDQGTAYLCRPRSDNEPSEHAIGNALDVIGFRFASGEPIPVQSRDGDGTLEEAFQKAVRAGACLVFSTVLGPGSDAEHADHLHLDVKEREGGFRICD